MTSMVISTPKPKFLLLDRLMADAQDFDWIIISDDDIELDEGAVDRLLSLAKNYDFALCQPARTLNSFTDHPLVQVLPGLIARQTRFVEIGPFICIRRDAAKLLLPFGESCKMGWGLDFVWPLVMEKSGLRMGIIDDVTIAHRLRRPAEHYNSTAAHLDMYRLLANRPHLTHEEAFTILEVYSE